ncbi:VOC family protein [soil metagenome]
MTCDLLALTFFAHDPAVPARFWGSLLGWPQADDRGDGTAVLLPNDDTGFELRFLPGAEEKVLANLGHFDLTSATPEAQEQAVARAIELGAQHLDVGQTPEEGHIVLADPEGKEFCVIEAGNNFLADCGFVGALSCDGTQAVGYFWSQALGWPLVWDQDEETAIRSPHGGPKITWGGPPLAPRSDPGRVHFALIPAPGAVLDAEVARLISLGATRSDSTDADSPVELADPDGTTFWVLPAQQ